MDRIAILGPGGVGAFLAAALDRAGAPVVLIAREATAEVIARDGIRVRSRILGDFTAHPEVVSELEGPAGALVVATKSVGMDDALERVAGAEPEIVVPLLNGLDHVGALREHYGTRAVAGTIRIESDRPEPGVVVQGSPFLRIDVASDDPAPLPALERFAARMSAAEVPTRVGDSEAQVLWSKLVRLNALACTTSAYDLPLGPIRDDPAMREDLEGCVREAIDIAVADGAQLDFGTVMEEIEEVHPELTTSMQRDIAAGRTPELDGIPGSVMRAGARHGIETPTIQRLAARAAGRAGVTAPTV